MRTLSIFSLLVLLVTFFSCGRSPKEEKAAFVTLLGDDTLVVEQFTIREKDLEAEVLVRTPKTSYHKYKLSWDEEGKLQEFWGAQYTTPGEELENEQVLQVVGDSLAFTQKTAADSTTHNYAGSAEVLPFLDMIHWPYELTLRRMLSRQLDGLDQPMFMGRNVSVFEIRRVGSDSVSIKHPFRGIMYAKVGPSGELDSLDASETTRKLKVYRAAEVDLMAMKDRFVAADAAGKGIGPLSGQAEEAFTVGGANIQLSYGQPSRRGRELFGALVPWQQRWRTGANRATHFSTDQDLQMGELSIPAGTYTLYTIPAPEGGVLIINRQTGQNGTSYDESQDLGRVPMTRARQESSVEQFTIRVEEMPEGGGGVLQLVWGNDRFEIPFLVKKSETMR